MDRTPTFRRSAVRALVAFCAILAAAMASAQSLDDMPAENADELVERFEASSLGLPADGPADEIGGAAGRSELLSSDAGKFDKWQPLLDDETASHEWDEPLWRPMDRIRSWGFRHSSTHGRHIGRGLPLERSSWMNRPYHVDWFAGPMTGSKLSSSAEQGGSMLSGLRIGWDLDYYWGLDWRIGWANPHLQPASGTTLNEGSYMVSDVDVVYYPWGDSKFRPYLMLGLGAVQLETLRANGHNEDVTLLGLPFGAGIRFLQTPWLSWRLEMMQNLAFGGSGVNTIDNVSFTGGMEWRFGAKPNSYWPWRTARRVW